MIIEKVTIRQGLFEKVFPFSNKNNLIHSHINSVGKTTLMRVILYSIGYSVPSTKMFPLDKCEIESQILTDDGRRIKLVRNSPSYMVCYDGEEQQTFCLPEQQSELQSLFFRTGDVDILDNLLGVFYLDQEKGWTLLNRGVVIGSIHFNVEDFIQGLSGRDCSELKRKRNKLEIELGKYEQISNVTKYKESLAQSGGSLLRENPDDELDSLIEQKQVELNLAQKELARIDKSLKNNQQVKHFIGQMKLTVETPRGELLRVTADNVVGLNDSIDYLVAKRNIQAVECNKLLSLISRLKEQKKQSTEVFFTVESIADAFDQMVQKFPYGYMKVESIKESLKAQLKEVRKQISERTKYNNEVLNSLYANVIRYAEELGVNEGVNANYLFTSNLRVLSGALLHKTVFAFRLAYILEVKRVLGVALPIILDSPSGKEIDNQNIQMMINILKRDFSDHQIIIASIFEYDLPDVNVIEIKKRLLEDS